MADVFALIRDHYEGTEFDMTQGIDAGPFGLPRRWRPLTWKVDGVEYCLGAADIDAANRVFEHNAIAGLAAGPDRRRGLVRHGRQLHHLLSAVLLRHRRRAQELCRRLDHEVLLGLGVVGVQCRANYA